jgi:hypothetical protein
MCNTGRHSILPVDPEVLGGHIVRCREQRVNLVYIYGIVTVTGGTRAREMRSVTKVAQLSLGVGEHSLQQNCPVLRAQYIFRNDYFIRRDTL